MNRTIQPLIATVLLALSSSLHAAVQSLEISSLQNRPTIMLSINGGEPMLFLLDTGFGGQIMMDNDTAQTLGLTHRGTRVIDNMGMGSITIEDYESASLTINDLVVPVPAVAAQKGLKTMLSQLGTDALGNAPVGTISPWMLTQGTISFHGSGERIDIDNQRTLKAEPAAIPYHFDRGIPYFEARVAGKTLLAHLDTGSPAALILPAKMKEDFQYLQAPEERGRAQTVGRMHRLWNAQIDGDLVLGPVNVADPETLFIDSLPAVNVGLRALGNGKVTIDRTNQLILFEQQQS